MMIYGLASLSLSKEKSYLGEGIKIFLSIHASHKEGIKLYVPPSDWNSDFERSRGKMLGF